MNEAARNARPRQLSDWRSASPAAATSRPRDDAAGACLADPSATCDLKTPCAAGPSRAHVWVTECRSAAPRVATAAWTTASSSLSKSTAGRNAARAQELCPSWLPKLRSTRCSHNRDGALPCLATRASARTPGSVSTKALGPELLRCRGPLARPTTPRHRIKARSERRTGTPASLKVGRGWSPAPSATSRRAGSRCIWG